MGLNAKFGLNDGSFAVRYLLNFARDAYIIVLLRTCGGGKERGDDEMAGSETLSITMHYKRVELQIREILYVSIVNNTAEFHMADGTLYKMRFPFSRLEPLLGDEFIKTHRNCLVAVRAIHDLSDKVYLCDGSELLYASRRRKELSAELRVKRQRLFDRFADEHPARSGEQCRERYRVFDELPIAFMDIEAAVEPKENTVDWIVRYGNEALARLGEEPPGELIGKRLSDVYPGIKEKWLRGCERAAFYGQTLELFDYSPEVDAYLNIIAFRTAEGHCGCILLDFGQMQYARNAGDEENARLQFIAKFLEHVR